MKKLEPIGTFGPIVAKTKLTKEETLELYNICLDSNEPDNEKLVGYIKEENKITEKLRSSKVLPTIIKQIENYIKEIDGGNYSQIVKEHDFDSLVGLRSAWYNKQIHMEHNPIHNHVYSADLVCVIYPKVVLDENVENFKVNNSIFDKQQGQITFLYGQTPNLNGFGESSISILPEEGDILIFPSSMYHYTTPVLGDSCRYSISCNFEIHKHIKRIFLKGNYEF